MKIEYFPKGVCSRKMVIEIEDGILKDIQIIGGCSGNLQGISSLVKGMEIDEVIQRLEGTTCGMKATSCPDQLATALKEAKKAL